MSEEYSGISCAEDGIQNHVSRLVLDALQPKPTSRNRFGDERRGPYPPVRKAVYSHIVMAVSQLEEDLRMKLTEKERNSITAREWATNDKMKER